MSIALHGDSGLSDFGTTQAYISSAIRIRSPISATPAAAKEGIRVSPAPKSQAASNPTAIPAVPAQPTPEEETSAAVLQRVNEILINLRSSSPDSHPAQFDNVELATWHVLQNDHVESLDCKLEYLYPEKLVIVTYPSGVHESYNILLKPIADLADHPSGSFIVDTNRDIRLLSQSSVTPDFAFGRNIKNSSPKYSILFECAWTQPRTDLATKVDKCLDHPGVDAVICFEITSKKFKMPGRPPPPKHQLAPAFFEPVLQPRRLLGPVTFLELNWGQVDNISLTIHHRNGSQEHFERLAPVDGNLGDEDLLERQDDVNIAFAKLIGKVMSMDLYREALKGQTFGLNWDKFYVALDTRLMADAYDHYVDWMARYQTVAPFLKRRLSSGEGAGVTEGEDLVNTVTRRSKKHKQ